MFEFGGETSVAKSYSELLTSIINPNHVIAENYREQQRLRGEVPLESPMPLPQLDTMSVRQLIDLVAFLDSRYVLISEKTAAKRSVGWAWARTGMTTAAASAAPACSRERRLV
jgi:hypothetical protein